MEVYLPHTFLQPPVLICGEYCMFLSPHGGSVYELGVVLHKSSFKDADRRGRVVHVPRGVNQIRSDSGEQVLCSDRHGCWAERE